MWQAQPWTTSHACVCPYACSTLFPRLTDVRQHRRHPPYSTFPLRNFLLPAYRLLGPLWPPFYGVLCIFFDLFSFFKKIEINYCQASIVYYARHTALCPEEPGFCEEMKDTILSIFVLFGGITFPHQQRKSHFTSGSFIFLFPTDVCLQLVSRSKHVSNYHGCFLSSYLGQLSCLCHNTGLPPFFKTSDCFDASALVHPLNQFFCGFNPDKRQAYRPVRLLSVC